MAATNNAKLKVNNSEKMTETSAEKLRYDQKLCQFYENHSKNESNVKKPWTSVRISQVIEQIKSSRVTTQRKSMDYYWISKYDIMETADEEYLIFRKKSIDDPTVRIVPMEKYFEILTEVHKSVGHGGRMKIIYSIKNKLYIPKKAIEIFIDLCSVCETKRSVPKKGIVTKPIISKDFNVRGQVDLVDLQSAPDGEYKWLMNYQDHATKFLHLRPLKTKKATEVALELLKIFLEFGAPCILQSDNGKEFTAHVIEELVKMWPECKIIHGSPRRPQTQGSVERSNQDVENMLRCWMQDNKSTKWSIGCYFVQYYKNTSCHRIIGRSPYRAMFGSDPKTQLKGCYIPESLMSSIHTEEELNEVLKTESFVIENNETAIPTTIAGNDDAINHIAGKKHEEPVRMNNFVTTAEVYMDADEPNNNIAEVRNEILVTTAEVHFNADAFMNDIAKEGNEVLATKKKCKTTAEVYVNADHPIGEESIAVLEIDTNEQFSFDDQMCIVCGQGTSGAHACCSCSKPVHVICGVTLGVEGYGASVLCELCRNEQMILNEREQAHRGVKRAAEKMIDATAKKLPLLEIGNSVLLNVPKVDRGPLDTKNIVGKVVDLRNGVYKIGTSSGTIKNWFSRQDLQMSYKNYNEDISEAPVSLRQAVTCQSMFGGQGFQKCSCKPSKTQCHTNRCACFKNKSLCTSKCHHSLSCINK